MLSGIGHPATCAFGVGGRPRHERRLPLRSRRSLASWECRHALAKSKLVRPQLAKAPTGIQGLDQVTGGGLPKGRVTLLCGSAGCGKSLFAMEFLVHGAVKYGDPGVYMDFEETEKKLAANVASLGFDLPALVRRKKSPWDCVSVQRHRIAEAENTTSRACSSV